ncbi:DUF2142 domain-containing protein [Schaalia sp. JY-X159]|uniref:DUF2142 domain-containing protein n=1 Tax=Schaalia sp. JY-X159 TaxID=2758575 RepID=UPI002934A404|nr:DUF2142 domain-containing protein [Schaalia sp. JY-X159]
MAGLVGTLCILVGFLTWALVSPVGGSPDDDYHLGSTWCPNPVEGGSCDVVVSNGEVTKIVVPETVYMSQDCWAFHPETSAACTDDLADDVYVPSYRFDDGAYPPGYYRFHHTLVGPDVHRSVVMMRFANVILGLGGVVAVGALSAPRARQNLILATVAAWVPMGVYFVASNNPSSWAISGVLIYGGALVSAAGSSHWRRWTLLAFAVMGAGMAMMSRPDAAFYLLIVTLALWLLVPFRKNLMPEVILSGIATGLGLLVLLSSTQADNLTGDGGWPVDLNASTLEVLVDNIASLPAYAASLWGLGMGPGWLDVPLTGWATLVMVIVFGALLFAGAHDISWRNGFAAMVVFGALYGIPVVSMTLRHVAPVTYYQGRYMLPLLAFALLVWVQPGTKKPLGLSLGQTIGIAGIASVANASALATTILRFASGVTSDGMSSAAGEPWWPWAIGPRVVWIVGALCMTVGIFVLMTLVAHQSNLVTDTLVELSGSTESTRKGRNEGNHSGRRVGHAATPAHAGHIEAADAGVRQTDDLLPADDTDAGGNQ